MLAAIYRQEIIQDVTLFTSQSAAVFYDKLFTELEFMLPRAATGRRGFPKEAMVCAFIAMKCEGFTQMTDLADYLDNKAVIFMKYGAAQVKQGITLNTLKDEQHMLNMQLLLAIQNNDAETQAELEEQFELIENQIKHMRTGGSQSAYIVSGGIVK